MRLENKAGEKKKEKKACLLDYPGQDIPEGRGNRSELGSLARSLYLTDLQPMITRQDIKKWLASRSDTTRWSVWPNEPRETELEVFHTRDDNYVTESSLWHGEHCWSWKSSLCNSVWVGVMWVYLVKDLFLMLAHLSGTICLKLSATLILPPLSKPPSRRTCLIIISKLFFTALPIPSSDAVCVCVWLVLL